MRYQANDAYIVLIIVREDRTVSSRLADVIAGEAVAVGSTEGRQCGVDEGEVREGDNEGRCEEGGGGTGDLQEGETDGRMDGRTDRRADRWTGGRTGGRTDGQTNG